jgi:lactate dehydrogenase-like 2-hydroxyacid dehydrogenase
MQATVVDFAKDRVIYNMTNCTREELDNKINLFFTSEGYTPKEKSADLHTYTKGNRVLRLLLGAFVKYHKQSVAIRQEGDQFSVMLNKESSGMSGGLIGMNQVKKEFARLSEAFRAYFK